jgi:uncharacterized protein (DUF983 family)
MPPEDPRDLARRPKPISGQVEDYAPEDEDPDGPSREDVERFSDVTVKCPECGTQLFDDVEMCWKCGRALRANTPDETKVPVWVIATVVLIILAFVFVALPRI